MAAWRRLRGSAGAGDDERTRPWGGGRARPPVANRAARAQHVAPCWPVAMVVQPHASLPLMSPTRPLACRWIQEYDALLDMYRCLLPAAGFKWASREQIELNTVHD